MRKIRTCLSMISQTNVIRNRRSWGSKIKKVQFVILLQTMVLAYTPTYIRNTPTIMEPILKGFDLAIDFEGANVSISNYMPVPQYRNLLITFHVRGVNIIGTETPVKLEAPMFGAILTRRPSGYSNLVLSYGYVPIPKQDSLRVSERVNGLWGSATWLTNISPRQVLIYSLGLYVPSDNIDQPGIFVNTVTQVGENTTWRVEGLIHQIVSNAGISFEHETGVIAFKAGVEWIWKSDNNIRGPQFLKWIGITVHFQPITRKTGR